LLRCDAGEVSLSLWIARLSGTSGRLIRPSGGATGQQHDSEDHPCKKVARNGTSTALLLVVFHQFPEDHEEQSGARDRLLLRGAAEQVGCWFAVGHRADPAIEVAEGRDARQGAIPAARVVDQPATFGLNARHPDG
jgi:hypothetical protein